MIKKSRLPHIKPGCAPILLDGGPVGCVGIHGFTASPEELRWLAEYLHARGLTVVVPRLAGHGTDPVFMARQHWHDWYASMLDGLALARARCTTVFALGMSMGGTLALRAAAEGLFDGAAIMAAPVVIDQPLLRFARAIKYLKRMLNGKKGDLDERVRAIQRTMGHDDYGRAAYNATPVAAAAQLYALMQETRRVLPQITIPLQLIYSQQDETVPFKNLALIQNNVSSTDRDVRVLERSGHVLTQDSERDTVFAWVWDFIAARIGEDT